MAAPSSSLILRLVSASVAISKRAGVIIRDVLSENRLAIVEKGLNDLQTEADRSAQRCIVASLHKQFPKIAIFGEEDSDNLPSGMKTGLSSGEPDQTLDPDPNPEFIVTDFDQDVLKESCPDDLADVKDEDVVVWVDPLDGTSEYTQGLLDHVTVLIGIAVKGVAKAGVIYQPYYGFSKDNPGQVKPRCIWGVIGLGSFGYTPGQPPKDQKIIATTRSHSTPEVVDAYTACSPTEVIKVGGAGHKVLLLLEGVAHAYVFGSPGCKKWDTCAPEAVLHAVGGRLTDVHGNLYKYFSHVKRRNTGGVLATLDGGEHPDYVKLIPDSVKAALPTDG
ncbi:3'(2'),5'-bisphosphate nucleotidase 1-like isoform X2 [Lineus longissimus]|uniref:3'(2'),5'-bisphosphate nucleotidase 1-like isoform X2 n=1 Tax=Lineus longissimus TaxID=88925 RepID=UPI00315CC8EA